MRTVSILILSSLAGVTARADFSYAIATKSGSGAINTSSKVYLKGQKIKYDYGTFATIIDFGAQTLTELSYNRKTYTVTPFTQMGQARTQTVRQSKIDVKQTGQRKMVNGYNASQVILTIDMPVGSTTEPGSTLHVDAELWISPDVPGSQEMKAFYQKYADRFSSAVLGRGDQSMEKAIGEISRAMGALNGVVVQQIMKTTGGGQEEAQNAMADVQKQLDALKKQGNLPPQVAQRLSNMQTGSGGGSKNEIVQDSANFSISAIPDLVFAIPAGYQQSR
jgi:hypothetical protein